MSAWVVELWLEAAEAPVNRLLPVPLVSTLRGELAGILSRLICDTLLACV